MRLSSILKVSEPIPPRYKRNRAGRKGIGRFAVQRLGDKLTIMTQTKDAQRAIRVVTDWDRFEAGQDLSAITSRVEEIEKDRNEGTTLWIENLRDAWTESQMRRIWRYVSDLIQPFPLSKTNTQAPSNFDPGFRADINRRYREALIPIVDEETQIYDYATAEIDAEVDSEGRGKWSIKSRRFPQVNDVLIPIGTDREDPSEPFEYLRDIRLKAYYFIYNAGLIPPTMNMMILRMANRQGGVRLYRNGFRVLPYGEQQDDWLGLDKAYGRRLILPPIGNLNFFGFVEVTDPKGERFEETASREGLIENDAFRELTSFTFRVLRAAVLRVAEARDTKRIAAGRESQIEDPPEEKVRKAIDELRRITEERAVKGAEESGNDAAERDKLTATIDRLDEGFGELERNRAELIDELGMLRVLASLGIVIGEFTHEIRQTLTAAILNARQLVSEVWEPASARDIASKLVSNVDRIDSYARYFDRAVRENAQRKLAPQELGKVVFGFVHELKPSAERRDIKIETDVQGYDLYTCSMHSSELDSLLFNFYSNALKAIRRVRRPQSRILIRCGQKGERVFLEFADNGDGIPKELRERIFNPFFTTSTYGSDDLDDDLRGSGLGLKIVHDVATGYGGDVFLTEPPPGFLTCFRVELPACQ
jgi:signal transduction histidine kinase